jgi:hypothetical protein
VRRKEWVNGVCNGVCSACTACVVCVACILPEWVLATAVLCQCAVDNTHDSAVDLALKRKKEECVRGRRMREGNNERGMREGEENERIIRER